MPDTTSAARKWTPPPVGTPCWIEILAADVEACKKFYSELFPLWAWKPTTDSPDHKVAGWDFAGSSGLSGGIIQMPAECKASEQKNGIGMTVYFFVDSIEDTQKRVEELGGSTAGTKQPEGENGYYIYFKDVEGNRFGVYELKKSH